MEDLITSYVKMYEGQKQAFRPKNQMFSRGFSGKMRYWAIQIYMHFCSVSLRWDIYSVIKLSLAHIASIKSNIQASKCNISFLSLSWLQLLLFAVVKHYSM